MKLQIEELEPRVAPCIIGAPGPNFHASGHNPNLQTIYCITDPCPSGFDPGSISDTVRAATDATLREQARVQEAGFSQQVALFQLQQAVNRDSEAFQTLTNIQQASPR